jgi:bacteriorhodopsin
MAEIHVQAKKKASSTWIWILVSLIIIAAIAVYVMMRDNKVNEKTISQPSKTSFIMSEQGVYLI